MTNEIKSNEIYYDCINCVFLFQMQYNEIYYDCLEFDADNEIYYDCIEFKII